MVYSIKGKQDQNRQSEEHGPEDNSCCNKKHTRLANGENGEHSASRRNFKIQCQAEKAKRLLSHPLHQKLNQHIKSRLQRKSLNYKVKELEKKGDTASQLPHIEQWRPRVWLPIQRFQMSTKIPGVHSKAGHPLHMLKALTLETLDHKYPKCSWIHIYTDGSAEKAIKKWRKRNDSHASIRSSFLKGKAC